VLALAVFPGFVHFCVVRDVPETRNDAISRGAAWAIGQFGLREERQLVLC
jgi:hypothetical protein